LTNQAKAPTSGIRESKAGDDVQNALTLLATKELSDLRYYREGCRILAKHFRSPYACARVSLGHGNVDQTWSLDPKIVDRFRAHLEVVLLECQSGGRSIARVVAGDGGKPTTIMAVPVANGLQHASGALVLVDSDDAEGTERVRLSELRALVMALDASAPSSRGQPRGDRGVSQETTVAVSKASAYANLHEFAFALTNNLRVRMNCDQVALGVTRFRRIKLFSISGVDDPKPKQPGTHRMRQAMEECLDAGEVIFCQGDDRWNEEPLTRGHLLHKQWREDAGGAAVASVPLKVGDKTVGVVALRRPANQCFTKEDAATIKQLVEPYGAAMQLVKRASIGLFPHIIRTAYRSLSWLGSPRDLKRTAFLGALVALGLWFALGTMAYRVTLPATVAPVELRHCVAPFSGTISDALVSVGDRVEAGQLLYLFDTAEQTLKKSELLSELAAKSIEIDQAIAAGDRAAATLARSDVTVLEAQLATANYRLEQATGKAPVAGMIVRGDLARRVGQVVSQGDLLYEIVPDRAFRLEVEIDEQSLQDVAVGQRGTFSAVARPGTDIAITVHSIRPSAEIRHEKNIFVAEADMEAGDREVWMRAAMEGVVRIDVGTRRVWWVALHDLIDYGRLRFGL